VGGSSPGLSRPSFVPNQWTIDDYLALSHSIEIVSITTDFIGPDSEGLTLKNMCLNDMGSGGEWVWMVKANTEYGPTLLSFPRVVP